MSPYGPCAGWIRRILRRMGFDRNQMRRSSDRVEAMLRAGLLAVFVLGGPIATVYVGHGVYAAGLRTGRAQAAAWQRVPALVLHVKLVATAWRHPPGPGGPATLSVRWTAPDGSARTGKIGSGVDARVGGMVTVWIDASGRLAHARLTHADVVDHVIGAAVATPVVLAVLLCVVGWAASRVLDRHRLARWEADWLAVEPQWTRRRLAVPPGR
jgi:hypothetical protein